MNQVELIAKKRDGKELTGAELEFLVTGYVDGTIPDYQISAFLMAVYFQGMTPVETATLMRLMRDSGTVLSHDTISGVKADKHSTGGVGDKVSLILAPLVASAGLYVPMISGRALGHTGGTLDKLEAIPGFSTNLSLSALSRQLAEIGVVLVGQTEDLTPADKKIYSLRDATATVDSIPLITASILSKKMAEGIDALVLDVKCGNGAIFKEEEKAWELGRMLTSTAAEFGLKTSALITGMSQPLGNAIGNWLETREAIETLRGHGPQDLLELSLVLSAQMLVLGEKVPTLKHGYDLLLQKIDSGAAFAKFVEIVELQGGDSAVVQAPETYPPSAFQRNLVAPQDGYVTAINAREIGNISMAIGAGRAAMADKIDYTSGIVLSRKVGSKVARGDTLATAYSNDDSKLQTNMARLAAAFEYADEPPVEQPLIYGMIDATGEWRWEPVQKAFTS